MLKQLVQCSLANHAYMTPCGSWGVYFLPLTASKWCPTRRVLSHKKVPEKEAYLGNVLILRNSFLGMGSCQRLYISWLLDTSFVCTKEGRPFGGSRWKLQGLMLASWFLAYVTRPHKWRISETCGKSLCKVKSVSMPTCEWYDKWKSLSWTISKECW